VRSGDVNRYLATTAGMPLTAKDFRTWGANVSVAAFLAGFDPPETKGDLKRIQIEAIAAAATRLGNTVAVCRKSYIHPDVLTSFETGALQRVSAAAVARRERSGLQHEEAFLVELVRSWTTKRE
jgi:DNA topoisomerase-1